MKLFFSSGFVSLGSNNCFDLGCVISLLGRLIILASIFEIKVFENRINLSYSIVNSSFALNSCNAKSLSKTKAFNSLASFLVLTSQVKSIFLSFQANLNLFCCYVTFFIQSVMLNLF